jgi:hypothetical protein
MLNNDVVNVKKGRLNRFRPRANTIAITLLISACMRGGDSSGIKLEDAAFDISEWPTVFKSSSAGLYNAKISL